LLNSSSSWLDLFVYGHDSTTPVKNAALIGQLYHTQISCSGPELQSALFDKPSATTHILAGALDTQVPISGIELLLKSGDTPKDVWINPKGGHLGRQVKVWPDIRSSSNE